MLQSAILTGHSFTMMFHLDTKEEASSACCSSVSYKTPSPPKGLSFYTSVLERIEIKHVIFKVYLEKKLEENIAFWGRTDKQEALNWLEDNRFSIPDQLLCLWRMLSEGYLYGIAYLCEDLNPELYRKTLAEEVVYEMRSINYSSMDEAQGKSHLHRCRPAGKCISSVCSRSSKHSRRQNDNLLQPTQYPTATGQSSPSTLACEGWTRKDTYLVPSSCKSICKNYNDLHIAGDYVVPISSIMTDFTCDSGIGPFLESSEIPPPVDSARVSPCNDNIRKPVQGYSSCWRLASLVPHQQPLSDAALNDYLEQKLVELYKQYIMDSTASRASPTQIMASELIMTNVDQISIQISRERNMETSRAKDIVISRFLQIASEKIPSEISTPSLHISQYSHINA